jgi:predicted DNA-binding transcriptional regulator AlpA
MLRIRRQRTVTKQRKRGQTPGSHHIDRRAGAVLADPISDGPDDELLTTKQVSEWLGYSKQWLEIARTRGTGPRFHRMGPKRIVYRRGDVRAWLRRRSHQRTSEYTKPPSDDQGKPKLKVVRPDDERRPS